MTIERILAFPAHPKSISAHLYVFPRMMGASPRMSPVQRASFIFPAHPKLPAPPLSRYKRKQYSLNAICPFNEFSPNISCIISHQFSFIV